MLWPREAGKLIAARAKDVTILKEGVKECAKTISSAIQNGRLSLNQFKQSEVIPRGTGLSDEQLVNWTFLVDALNFNFWTSKGEPKYTVEHNGKVANGYMAMVNALNCAIDLGKPIYDPKYYSKLSLEEAKIIFDSSTPSKIPLIEKRMEVMSEISTILLNKHNGSFLSVLKEADGSALKLVQIVIRDFPCFRDVHFYEETEVGILKRAQILAADLWLLYKGEGLGNFCDLDQLTMFADYRVPQSLAYFGVLKYSDELLKKLDEEFLFECGERQEVEIRGVSIHAVELVVEECNKILDRAGASEKCINSIQVDYFLWDFRVSNAEQLEKIPYHKTRCIYY